MDASKSNVINDEIYNERNRKAPSNHKPGSNMIHIEDFHDGHHDHAYTMDENDFSDDQPSDGDKKYSEKKQSIAFLLCVTLGSFGGGRWYAGSYGLASLKMLLFLSVFVGICLLMFCIIPGTVARVASSGSSASMDGLTCCGGAYSGIGICVVILCYLGFLAFQITDIVLFVNNDITDEDGLMLKPM